MTYKNWPNENMTDLITLCNHCHKAIEAEKKYGSDDSFAIVARAFVKLFIKEYAPRDYSAQGDLNLCDFTVIKRYLYPYLMSKGLDADTSTMGATTVQEYFRNRRYEKILSIMEAGGEKEDVRRRYRFSEAMLTRVFSHPEKAKRLLALEERTE